MCVTVRVSVHVCGVIVCVSVHVRVCSHVWLFARVCVRVCGTRGPWVEALRVPPPPARPAQDLCWADTPFQ